MYIVWLLDVLWYVYDKMPNKIAVGNLSLHVHHGRSNIKHKMEFACGALFVHPDKSWLWSLQKLFKYVVSGPLDISFKYIVLLLDD